MMRIITGSARGTKLYSLEGDATRPTSERTKEALFSMLGETVLGADVLDLFAGSGQLGLEALSRGATSCVFGENSKSAQSVVQKNIEKTHLVDRATVVFGDGLQTVKRTQKTYDLVFLDPPYDGGFLPRVLKALLENHRLNKGAVVYCESRAFEDVFGADKTLADAFDVQKQTHYGIAYVTLLQWKGDV